MNQISEITNSAISLVQNASSTFDSLIGKYEEVTQKKLSLQNMLRAYYFEVLSNIEYLNCININKIKNYKINSPEMVSLLSRLEIKVGAALLYSSEEENKVVFELLRKKGRIENKNKSISIIRNGNEVATEKKVIYENILQAISFTVLKIDFMRKLVGVSQEELQILNGINIERRIINIRERFRMIKLVMDQMVGIKELAR